MLHVWTSKCGQSLIWFSECCPQFICERGFTDPVERMLFWTISGPIGMVKYISDCDTTPECSPSSESPLSVHSCLTLISITLPVASTAPGLPLDSDWIKQCPFLFWFLCWISFLYFCWKKCRWWASWRDCWKSKVYREPIYTQRVSFFSLYTAINIQYRMKVKQKILSTAHLSILSLYWQVHRKLLFGLYFSFSGDVFWKV